MLESNALGTPKLRNRKTQSKKDLNIPNSNQIDNFCRSNGFEMGWLDDDCGINKVRCHRDVLGLDEYRCIEWEERK